jgi:hypothetical protein
MGSMKATEPVEQDVGAVYLFKSDSLTLDRPRYYVYQKQEEEIIAWPFYFFCNTCGIPWTVTLPVDCSTGERTVQGSFVNCPRCGNRAGEFCDRIRDQH